MTKFKKIDITRFKETERIDKLLTSSDGRQKYLKELNDLCQKSSLIYLAEQSLQYEGDMIELGVFRGDSIRMLSKLVMDSVIKKTIYACDSYEGFPEDKITQEDVSWLRPVSRLRNKFKHTQDIPEHLESFFSKFNINGKVVKGYFENTLPNLSIEKITFAHIDCDSYSSHIECLNFVYSRIVKGGVIIFDDYHSKKWPGATKAIDEFFFDKPEKPLKCTERENPSWYLIKK